MELRAGTPEEAGLCAERLELVETRCREWVDTGVHPALCVLVARHGVIALHEAYGALGPQPDAPPLERDAIFPIASVTKPFTAAAVMALVEDGLVGLTRPVQEYVPGFVGEHKELVCVHHLLTHTSGMRNDEVGAYIRANLETADVPPSQEDIDPVLHRTRVLGERAPLWKKPGEEMWYCDVNYVILGEIVRRAAGCSLADFARERIFSPLGMRDTDYELPGEFSLRVVKGPPGWPLADLWGYLAPAGAIHSTAADLAVFGQTLLDGGTYGGARILSRAAVSEMTRNQIPGIGTSIFPGQYHAEASYGYGWIVACEKWARFATFPQGAFNHSGSTGSALWVDPSNDLIGVYLSVAHAEPVEGSVPELTWCVDLFANAVYAAVE